LKKIVVIGPESTGKSSLCEALAKYFDTLWCKEYAREYLLKNGKNYSYENLLEIAKGQIALEEKAIAAVGKLRNQEDRMSESLISSRLHDLPTAEFLFIDTDMYVMKVWCEYVFNKCHSYILEQIVERKYDLYLLCNTDLPWVADELREYPDEQTRKELFKIYYDIMLNQSVPFGIVSGTGEARLQSAVGIIHRYLR